VGEEWLTIAEIAQRTHLAENTARRYAKLFAAFLPSRTPGRTKHYPREAIAVLTRVAALYQAGRTTGDILDLLPQEFPRLVEAEATADSPPPAPARARGRSRRSDRAGRDRGRRRRPAG
jgi:DNA-binding transcriptional MerR regulator